MQIEVGDTVRPITSKNTSQLSFTVTARCGNLIRLEGQKGWNEISEFRLATKQRHVNKFISTDVLNQ